MTIKKIPLVDKPTLVEFGLGAWAGYFSTIEQLKQKDAQQKPQEIRLSPCMGHDMVCSWPDAVPLVGFGFTGPKFGIIEKDKKHITIAGFPCLGLLSVDLEKCCINHDIALWCAHNEREKFNANETAALCMSSQIANGVFNAYKNFWRLLCMGIISILGNPFTAIFTLVDIAIITAESAYQILLALNTGTKNINSDLVNYDGRHDNSCLCGGTEPTTMCNDSCRHLCKEYSKKYSGCVDCECKCINKDGKHIGTIFNTGKQDEFDDSDCCPGTGYTCRGTSAGREAYLKGTGRDEGLCSQHHCPSCSYCSYKCTHENGKYSYKLIKSVPDLDCCYKPIKPNIPCPNLSKGFIS